MTTNYLAKLPQEVKDHVGRYLDLKSIARARLASKGMNFFLPSERAKLNRHSRVWGSIMRFNDWNERLWGIVAESYGGDAEDYDMVLLGSDLEFLYYADDEQKKPPPDYGPLHLWKVNGCWQDVRQQPDARQPNGLRRHEGLGFKLTMEKYGYAWFLDKIDWNTLTFRQPYAAYMMFNNPSMQNVYRARYHQVRDVRIDFIRVNKVYQWMLESIVNNAMLKEHQPLQLAEGNRLAVKNIDVLFAWLWKSKDNHFERQGWNEKPHRMLFQQSFHAIKTTRGKASARKWRQESKRSFLGSHWILPYPHSRGFIRKDKEEKQFVWWPIALARIYSTILIL
ncbi:uncharacterized protein FFNC_15390 [Fusarium fujikuroi]|nr:uncharacterized protein FFNC_15390 [Fusarium fujikuroi]